ncbi:MAG: VCBS repeat-containing protein [Deltaproteobacteria bacterium]|jgi:large repetitive protein|nr:VCBS repeat-containing protein [Deltaproteobacteria bacterium]
MKQLLIFLSCIVVFNGLFAQENTAQEATAENPEASSTEESEITIPKYKWEQQYYHQINGEKSLVFAHEMRSSKLAFADIDDDGDMDIFLGQMNGEIAYFENKGSLTHPEYELITQQYKAIFETRRKGQKVQVRNVINVKGRSAPYLTDIDSDGDLDLFIGSKDGSIWYFKNLGNNLVPVFKLETPKYENISVGRNSVPLFADIDLKRKKDLLVGTEDGKVWLFFNDGTRKKANFHTIKPIRVASLGLETHASPGLFDWDEDGDLDLVVGQNSGTLTLFTNDGDRFYPKWKFTEENFQQIDIGGESAPYFIDMDDDGDKDLVLGSANPTVFHYENRIQDEKRTLWNRSTNLFNFHKLIVTGERSSLATGDLDGDGDLDLIIGEARGNLNYYENIPENKVPNWVLKSEELIFMTGVQNSSPDLGDIDGDGDLDLIIGGQQGQIAFVENIGTPKSPKWELKEKTYFQIDVGSNAVPKLIDIDFDDDLDMLIGNYAGRVNLFLNKGSKTKPEYTLESTRFASIKTENNATPAFFDWNQDKFPDLIFGDEKGKLGLALSPGKTRDFIPNWVNGDKALFVFNVYGLSHPIMQDIDGDGANDLLIGNEKGDFLLYLNRGIDKIKEEGKEKVDNTVDQDGTLVVEELETPEELKIEIEVPEDDEDTFADVEETFDDGPKRVKIDPKYVRIMIPLIENDDITRSVPAIGDLDLDGDFDIIIGSSSGLVYYYENQGNETEWDFKLVDKDFLKTEKLRNTAPILFDLDQDSDLDIILGTRLGKLLFYENQGTVEHHQFILNNTRFNKLWLGRNARPAAFDLNQDNFPDLLVGTFFGKITYVKNDSSRFEIIRRDYNKIDIDIGATPIFSDLNNSDTPELVIGSDDGVIHFLRNTRDDLQGEWLTIPQYGAGLTYPRGTSPAVADLDNDGDPDLISGSEPGMIILFQNEAIEVDTEPNIDDTGAEEEQ